eukprot:s259_g36.t1
MGLHDGHLLWTLHHFVQWIPHPLKPLIISPRRALDLLRQQKGAEDGLGKAFSKSDDRIICVFPSASHWAVLFGQLHVSHLQWTYCDGLPDLAAFEATRLAALISEALVLDWSIEPMHIIRQQDDHTCGSIALLHVGVLLGLFGLPSHQAILDLHGWLLSHPALGLPGIDPWIYGSGPTELQAQLAALLATKGVPSSQAADRAAAALKKLQASAVQSALSQANPWQALKALTTKPGCGFQFVLKTELQAHIDSKAKSKHGAHISVQKKQKDKRPSKPDVPGALLDPETLLLNPAHFVDDEGDQVAQIKLSQVTADARGIAIASLNDTLPYLKERKNISSDALAILITEEIPPQLKATANVTAIRFPVTYLPTQDPLLIHGSLLQLGDHPVTRQSLNDPVKAMDIVETHVLKIQMFRDELSSLWDAIASSPVRQLFTLVPLLRLCTSVSCDHRCGHFHAAVEDSMDQVVHEIWGRRFQSIEGRSTPAPQADIFLVFLRIAAPALPDLVKIVVEGVYLEPRANGLKATDPDYSVIWLPGTDRDAAVHRLKLTTHGLSLVRMKTRFGIRVLSSYEESAFRELRPGDSFLKVAVTKVFKIHPLPHGLQRQQIVKLLSEWNWQARPLQPARGSAEGGSWEIGASVEPPNNVMPAFQRDVLISLVKDKSRDAQPPPALVAPARAQRHLRSQVPPAIPSNSAVTSDPWQAPEQDPWANFHSTQATPASSAKRYDVLAEKLKTDLQASLGQQLGAQLQEAHSSSSSHDHMRLQKLETDMEEIKAHQSTFHTWFKETGTRLASQDEQLGQLQSSVLQNQQDLRSVRAEVHTSAESLHQAMQLSFGTMKSDLSSELTGAMTSQMDRIEAMLSKRQRSES